MRINLKIIAVTLAVSMLAMSSCKDDNDPELVPAEEAEVTMQTMGAEMETTTQQLMTTQGSIAIMNLMMLTEFDIGMKSSLAPLASSFEFLKNDESLANKLIGAVPKMLSAKEYQNPLLMKGTFTWNFLRGSFEVSDEPKDKLIYVFPSDPTQTENNATLTISKFEIIESGEDYFPTSVQMSLVVGDQPVMSLDYDANQAEMAINSLDITLTLVPFEMTSSVAVTGADTYVKVDASASIKNQNITIASTSMEMQFDDMTSLDPFIIDKDLEPTTAKGYMQMGEIKAQLDMAMAAYSDAIEGISDKVKIETAANANLLVAFYTYPGGLKLGDIVWKWDTAEMELVAYFKFNNGVEKPLEEVLDLEENFFDI